MIIENLSFEISANENSKKFTVHVGEKIKVKVDGKQTLEGKICGAFIDEEDKWRIAIYGRYLEHISKELDLHVVYVPYITEMEYQN